MKYSRQREIVRNIIDKANNHPTVEEVYAKVQMVDRNISIATVYRNLNLLAENGEIQKLNFFDEADRFDPNIKEHTHFVCKKCGKIIDINDDAYISHFSLDKEVEKKYRVKVDNHSLVLYGICNDCKLHK